MDYLVCIYKGNKTECRTDFVSEGCVRIPRIGNEINIEKLDELYRINSTVVYKGYSFDDFTGIRVALKTKEIYIFTTDFKVAERFKFDRHDVGTWRLGIPMSEVDKVVIEKEYLIGEKKGTKECYEEDIMTFADYMDIGK